MPASQTLVEQRTARGQSHSCARSHHDRCPGGTCTCQCHADPEAFARRRERDQDAAARAWETRRAGGAAQTSRTSSAGAAGETAPKRPDIKSGVKAAIPAAAARQIKSEFAFGIWALDQGAASWRPQLWQTPEDRLRQDEITSLVTVTYNEIEARAPWLLKLLAKVGESAPEAALIYTVAIIALPRLARHGAEIAGVKITPELANAVAFAPLVASQLAQQPGAAGVGAESTPVADRPNGHGQIDPGSSPFTAAAVRAGAEVQAGYGPISDGSGDPNGARNGRYEA